MSRSDNPTGKATTPWVLVFSIVANCVLAVTAVKLLAKPATPPAAPANRMVTVAVETQVVVTADSPASLIWVTNQFHWRQIESTNYEAYVANLRAIGCPEKTLRDLVLADVRRHYATRRRDVKTDLPFWTGGRKLKASERARTDQQEALDKEQAALIQRLLGIEWSSDQSWGRMDHFEEQAIARFLLGPMEDEKFWRAVRLSEKYEALRNALEHRTGDILTDADEAESRGLAQSLKRELQAALGPTPWEEMIARMGAVELFKNDALEAMEVTPAEARRIALDWSGDGTSFGFFGFSRDETAAEQKLREQQFTNSVARLLGEERFADYERAQDYDFRRLFTLAQENNLPKEAAVKVFGVRQLAVEEVERVRHDASLDEVARGQKFDQMQSELQQAVSGALGATAYQEYLKGNGAWITNVTKL